MGEQHLAQHGHARLERAQELEAPPLGLRHKRAERARAGDLGDGSMVRGWAGYLTLYSAEKNTRADGTPKINLNQDDLQQLYQQLTEVFDEETARFVVAYRQFGPAGGGGDGPVGRGHRMLAAGHAEVEVVQDQQGEIKIAPAGRDNVGTPDA